MLCVYAASPNSSDLVVYQGESRKGPNIRPIFTTFCRSIISKATCTSFLCLINASSFFSYIGKKKAKRLLPFLPFQSNLMRSFGFPIFRNLFSLKFCFFFFLFRKNIAEQSAPPKPIETRWGRRSKFAPLNRSSFLGKWVSFLSLSLSLYHPPLILV